MALRKSNYRLLHTARRVYPVPELESDQALIIRVCLLFHTITAHPIVCHRNVKQKCKAKIG